MAQAHPNHTGPKAAPTGAGPDDHRTSPYRPIPLYNPVLSPGLVPRRRDYQLLTAAAAAALLLLALCHIYTLCWPLGPLITDPFFTANTASDSQPIPTTNAGSAGNHLHVLFHQIILFLIRLTAMVSARWGGLAARAAYLASSVPSDLNARADQKYATEGLSAARALQGWYDSGTGLWKTTGWWNSANCLTVLADFGAYDPSDANAIGLAGIISNTFSAAQTASVSVAKVISSGGLYHSSYVIESSPAKRAELRARGFKNFLNNYYDDEGWWALGLIRSYDITNNTAYLSEAETIFADMKAGTDSTCGGGIWWSKDKNYKNAIANELYLSVAASLANRVTAKKSQYLKIAQDEYKWFRSSGMINSQNLINDGLTINSDGSCTNNQQNTWSYNQGVILGGLVELSKASRNSTYLSDAVTIATAALNLLQDSDGIIHESGGCEPDCGGDGSQFKGIFVRNLGYLQKASPQAKFKTAILKNADTIWSSNRNSNNQFGIDWSGPATAGSGPDASTHSSAMDVIVAAYAVS